MHIPRTGGVVTVERGVPPAAPDALLPQPLLVIRQAVGRGGAADADLTDGARSSSTDAAVKTAKAINVGGRREAATCGMVPPTRASFCHIADGAKGLRFGGWALSSPKHG